MKLNFSHSAMFHIKTRVSLNYFVNGCSSTLVTIQVPFYFILFNQVFSFLTYILLRAQDRSTNCLVTKYQKTYHTNHSIYVFVISDGPAHGLFHH